MSHARGLLTPILVTIIGVGTGIAIFDPAFKQEKEKEKVEVEEEEEDEEEEEEGEKAKKQQEQEQIIELKEQHAPSPAEHIRKTEQSVANIGGATTIPKDTERWSEIQTGQFSKPVDTFKWSEVPLDQYNASENSS